MPDDKPKKKYVKRVEPQWVIDIANLTNWTVHDCRSVGRVFMLKMCELIVEGAKKHKPVLFYGIGKLFWVKRPGRHVKATRWGLLEVPAHYQPTSWYPRLRFSKKVKRMTAKYTHPEGRHIWTNGPPLFTRHPFKSKKVVDNEHTTGPIHENPGQTSVS